MEADPADVIRSPGPRPEQAAHDPPAEIAADPGRFVTELFRAHHLELVRLAVLIVGDLATAEDVVQDAFEQLHRRWRTLRKQSSALDYARSAVLNGSRSVLRRRSVARRHEAQIAAPEQPDADAALVFEQRTELIEAFRALPARQREVLALRYYVDMSVADAAATLHITEGAVRSTASRGLDALARILPSRIPKEP
jgi:RNA polymerase sigma-70 factor (sigma-E family)